MGRPNTRHSRNTVKAGRAVNQPGGRESEPACAARKGFDRVGEGLVILLTPLAKDLEQGGERVRAEREAEAQQGTRVSLAFTVLAAPRMSGELMIRSLRDSNTQVEE